MTNPIRLWSVNAESRCPVVSTAYRYELGPVINDYPHVPVASTNNGWNPKDQAIALAELLSELPPGQRGIDLNNLLIPHCYYPRDPAKRFAKRDVVLHGFSTGSFNLFSPWFVDGYGKLPSQPQQLWELHKALVAKGIELDFIWIGEPEGYTVEFLDTQLLKDILATPEWQKRELSETYDDVDPIINDPWSDHTRYLSWYKTTSKALYRIVINGVTRLLNQSQLVSKTTVVATPFVNTGRARVPLIDGNFNRMWNLGKLDSYNTICSYLFQSGARTNTRIPSLSALEIFTRTAGQRTCHLIHTQGETFSVISEYVSLAADLGHHDIVFWSSPGYDPNNLFNAVSNRLLARQQEIDFG